MDNRIWYWIVAIVIVDLALKGYALWRAGRNNQGVWFVALYIINSIGILPIIYLAFFQRKNAVPEHKRKRKEV